MKKDVVRWPLISTVASGLVVWWLINQKPPVDNPIAIPLGIIIFGVWAFASFYILVKNLYCTKKNDLPKWIRWIKKRRCLSSLFTAILIFFMWQMFTSKNPGIITISIFFAAVSAILLLMVIND